MPENTGQFLKMRKKIKMEHSFHKLGCVRYRYLSSSIEANFFEVATKGMRGLVHISADHLDAKFDHSLWCKP